ncbi:alpha/beta hydrolase [Streptomyces sp. ML-6]|uniref:alpha/beta fold hydrolase n=1 Tax=Streptomyces sp. ML-6 TaxID=2982693 RepID=UPI0024BF120A|nr:alpha/beta hydrolase [Streptomyces sp. ML-6]MDK0524737.1 alpha/beta hydrolase [Streptomyces sp. ML-6]
MTTVRNATLSAPGADLYYEVRGEGPLLLISESGEGDARRSIDLVGRLATDHTVVTYDRRGLSRSTRTDPTVPITLARHADDVHRLLTELTDGPATVLGLSLGAVIGLHLAVEHPDPPLTLIAHEPVAPGCCRPPNAPTTNANSPPSSSSARAGDRTRPSGKWHGSSASTSPPRTRNPA